MEQFFRTGDPRFVRGLWRFAASDCFSGDAVLSATEVCAASRLGVCFAWVCDAFVFLRFFWPVSLAIQMAPIVSFDAWAARPHALQEWSGRRMSPSSCCRLGATAYLAIWGIGCILAAGVLAVCAEWLLAWNGRGASSFSDPAEHFTVLRTSIVALAALCAGWALFDWLTRNRPNLQAWVAPVVMAASVVLPWQFFESSNSTPQWRLDHRILDHGPLDTNDSYFVFMSFNDAYATDSENGLLRRFGNTAMYAGVRFVNGYSATAPQCLEKLFWLGWSGFISPPQARPWLKREASPDGLLQQMGVDGIGARPRLRRLRPATQKLGWNVVLRTKRGHIVASRRPAAATGSLISVPSG